MWTIDIVNIRSRQKLPFLSERKNLVDYVLKVF